MPLVDHHQPIKKIIVEVSVSTLMTKQMVRLNRAKIYCTYIAQGFIFAIHAILMIKQRQWGCLQRQETLINSYNKNTEKMQQWLRLSRYAGWLINKDHEEWFVDPLLSTKMYQLTCNCPNTMTRIQLSGVGWQSCSVIICLMRLKGKFCRLETISSLGCTAKLPTIMNHY